MSNDLLSIITPTFNNRKLTLENCFKLDKHLSGLGLPYEMILVDDGSQKEERVRQVELPSACKLIQLDKNMGKGFAVRKGMLAASGACCIYTDIDLPYDLSAIKHSYNLVVKQGFDFVTGDRTLHHSRFEIKQTLLRRITSCIFSKFVTLFVISGIIDSQCGFKVFSGHLANNLFPLLTINRFSFDVEIFYLLLKYNISIKRIPVKLCNTDASTINVLKHAFEMAKIY